jgi:OFA family oxalate/formate antiporter-like MFS transporter
MLTAWGFASAFGPLFIAYMRETSGSYGGALHVIAGVMAVSILLPILVRPPRTAAKTASRSEKGALPKEGIATASRVRS